MIELAVVLLYPVLRFVTFLNCFPRYLSLSYSYVLRWAHTEFIAVFSLRAAVSDLALRPVRQNPDRFVTSHGDVKYRDELRRLQVAGV